MLNLCFLSTLLSCAKNIVVTESGLKSERKQNIQSNVSTEKSADSLAKNSFYTEEIFTDSLTIGNNGKNKVIIEKFKRSADDEVFVLIKFYYFNSDFTNNKKNIKWYLTNKYYFEKDDFSGLDVVLKDFNHDGFLDFTYRSANAARGGNEVRKLFIYDAEEKEFIYIKNSEDYPNMYYNSQLNCINSLILTGSTATAFLHLKKDSLQEFARVDVSDSIRVKELGKDGKMHRILTKKYDENFEDFYVPYINYKPLELDKN